MDFYNKLVTLDYFYTQLEKEGKTRNEYPELEKLLDYKLILDKNAIENLSVFIDHLDIVMKYTDINSKWVTYSIVYQSNYFIGKLIKCLNSVKNKCQLTDVLLKINKFYNVCTDSVSGIFDDKLLCEYLNICASNRVYTYNLVFNEFGIDDKWRFLKLVLMENIRIDLSILPLDSEMRAFVRDNILEFASFTPNLVWLRDVACNTVNFDKWNGDYEMLPPQSKKCLDTLDEYLSLNLELIVDSLLSDEHFAVYNNGIKELIGLIILDILKNRVASISDIRWLRSGFYSDVLAIKDKVLKTGNGRSTLKIPYNPYMIKSLMRRSFIIDNQMVFIEVAERAIIKRVDKEKIYELFCKLRDKGIIWPDCHAENVGYLADDNVIHWNGNLNPSKEMLGLIDSEFDEEILSSGELVIIDNDIMYLEDDLSEDVSVLIENNAFEKRYHQEKTWFGKIARLFKKK